MRTKTTTPIRLRPSQSTAYRALADVPYGILNAPTGWGKSLCLSALVSTDSKVIVSVPQRSIAKGFLGSRSIELPNGQIIRWKVSHDLCADSIAKVRQLRAWLLDPESTGVVVTTHHSLALAWKTLQGEEVAQAVHHLSLVVDEAHHLQGDDDANRLGEAIDQILDADDPSSRLLLATAFFFRGDGAPIIHADKIDRFQRHSIPLDEYWASLKHIKTYSYDFVTFGDGDVVPELERLLEASQEPTIIYLPREGHRLHLGRTKDETTAEVVGLIRQHQGAELWHPGYAGSRAIIDLVSRDYRPEKIAFVAEHGDRVAAILAVGMWKEGADWPMASRVIDLLPAGSDQDRGQRFGRLIRDYPGKSHISYYSFLPYQPDASLEDQREQFARLYAHFHASLVLEHSLSPIKLPSSKVPKGKRETKERVDYFGTLDSQTQREIIGDCYTDLIGIAAKDGKVGPDEARKSILGVLDSYRVAKDYREPMAKQIAAMLRRRHDVGIESADLVAGGFDKVWSETILDDVLVFTADFGGPTTFAEIRAAIAGAFEARWLANYDKVKSLTRKPSTSSAIFHWCTHNRTLHKRGELPQEKISALESIPWWTWTVAEEDRWTSQLGEVSGLPECPPSGTKGYTWVRQQRRMYDQGKLSQDKIQECESIPWWVWTSLQDKQQANMARLAARSTMPRARVEQDDYDLLKYYRKRRREGKLSADRIAAFDLIPWWTWD